MTVSASQPLSTELSSSGFAAVFAAVFDAVSVAEETKDDFVTAFLFLRTPRQRRLCFSYCSHGAE